MTNTSVSPFQALPLKRQDLRALDAVIDSQQMAFEAAMDTQSIDTSWLNSLPRSLDILRDSSDFIGSGWLKHTDDRLWMGRLARIALPVKLATGSMVTLSGPAKIRGLRLSKLSLTIEGIPLKVIRTRRPWSRSWKLVAQLEDTPLLRRPFFTLQIVSPQTMILEGDKMIGAQSDVNQPLKASLSIGRVQVRTAS